MKKLLHIQLLPLMSGVQRFSLHLLDGLDRDEFEIYVACKPGGEFVNEINRRGYKYIQLPSFRHAISLLDAVTLVHLIGLIHKHKFDIVHTHSSKPGLLGRFAARLCKVPLIMHTAHGTAFQDGQRPAVYRFYMLMEAMGNALGHRTVFVNNSDRLSCINKGLISSGKAVTIFNAMQPKQAERLASIAACRAMPSGEIIIGSTIRFSRQKNVISLVTAACKACMVSPALKFIFVGEGEHYALCQAIVHSYGLEQRVILPGWDSEVSTWLKTFNAFVLYSRWEAMPYSIIEAMSCGLPVIGSLIPSIAELVDDSCGYLVALDDEAALIQAFKTIADNFAPAYAKGKQGAIQVNELCHYKAMVAGYREIYLADTH